MTDTEHPIPPPEAFLRSLLVEILRAPADLAPILRTRWAHQLALIANDIDGMSIGVDWLTAGPVDTADKLFVEVDADGERFAMAKMLHEVATRVTGGDTIGQAVYCAWGYRFFLSPHRPKHEAGPAEMAAVDAAHATTPPALTWTREMGLACLRRMIARAEQEGVRHDELRDIASMVERGGSWLDEPSRVAHLGLRVFGQIPHEVLPFLAGMVEPAPGPEVKQEPPAGVSSAPIVEDPSAAPPPPRAPTPELRLPAGMSLSSGLNILYGGDGIRAAAYGSDEEAIPVIERFSSRIDDFEPLVSWDGTKLPKAEALAYAQTCIDTIRAQGASPAPTPTPSSDGGPAHTG